MKKTTNRYDVIVVGAGPAGLACSTELTRLGLAVAVVDEQAHPGGNIYRNVTKASKRQRSVLGADYAAGQPLVEAFLAAAPDYWPEAHVWQAESTGAVNLSQHGSSRSLRAEYLVLSTGTMERPVPFPGWTLPGVMTCGGVSNLFKDSGLVPSEPLVLAGSGPFLWLVAEHLFAMEAPVAAILDTTPRGTIVPAVTYLPRAMMRLGYLMKGLRMMAAVKSSAKMAGTPIYSGVRNIRADGDEHLERVTAEWRGKVLRFDVPTLLVHEGIIPTTPLLRQVGCAHVWNPVQRYWHPSVAADGGTNLPAVFVAGDGAFVHGARAAELKGRRTALSVAKKMGRISVGDHDAETKAVNHSLRKELIPRPFIDAFYAPRKDLYAIADETTICRCEGVTAGDIRGIVAQGFFDHNEIKSIIRSGMGPCQGRMCGPALLEVVAESSGVAVAETRALRQRPPIKPLSLEELANAEIGTHEG